MDMPAEFKNVLAAVAVAFSKELSKEAIAVYWNALADLPMQSLKSGAARAIREGKFFPTVAELRRLSGQLTVEQRASQAWTMVRANRSIFAARRRFVFDDPIITSVVHYLGGAGRFWNAHGDDLDVWLRKDFEAAYVRLAPDGVALQRLIEGVECDLNLYAGGKPVGVPAEVEVVATGLPWAEPAPTAIGRDPLVPRLELRAAHQEKRT